MDGRAATAHSLDIDFNALRNTHDLRLPAWGPYSKKYAGISHTPNLKTGLRFDVSVFPGFYRGGVLIPNVLFQSGYYPWQLNTAMDRVTYRYELEWKDKVFVDTTYSTINSNAVLVAMRCVNNADVPQELALNLMAYLDFPEIFPNTTATIPPGTIWINAVDYSELTFARPRPTDTLVYDGWMRGEARSNDYLDGSAIAKNFGNDRGDAVKYTIPAAAQLKRGMIQIRYRLPEGKRVAFQLHGLAERRIEFVGTGKFELLEVPFENSGSQELSFISEGGTGIELNGFFVGAEGKEISLQPVAKDFVPAMTTSSNSVILKYPQVNCHYGLAWDYSPSVFREFLNDEMDIYFRKMLQEHVSKKMTGNSLGHYANAFLRPIELTAHSERTVYAFVCNGTRTEVQEQLAAFLNGPQAFIAQEPKPDDQTSDILPEGKRYAFGQSLMRATTLDNVVYPIYTQRSYIHHFTPGKWWNSLYTWDSGFISLGLAEIDTALSAQCLNAYTTPTNNQSAFIHHGSPVPVQVYDFLELWNRTQSPELSAYFYPRLKRYYEFMVGRTGSSTTRTLHSNLLKTWDYFYSSGGWDDYPPQKAVHDQHLEKTVAPIITTAHCIRFAKILRMFAEAQGLIEDVTNYDTDIQSFSQALQKYSWDGASGYFSYVVHDGNGNPTGFLKHAAGQNYNMGLDGAYPLLSGICTTEQQTTLLEKIFSEKNMWTPSGICVVDRSASYYRNDGYWNGAVWMPHQWFMWKTMLDLGRPDLAQKIAKTALDVWTAEAGETYFTFEHFLADTGRGAGWHQFSGLSTPVLAWFSAYYKPGTVSTGFEVFIRKQAFSPLNRGYEATLAFDNATSPHKRSMLVCLNPASEYTASFNGQKLNVSRAYPGLIQIDLPPGNAPGTLLVTAN